MTTSFNPLTTMTLLVAVTAITVLSHSQVIAEPPAATLDPFEQSHRDSVENRAVSSEWHVAYRPVPELLRMHLPRLPHDLGLLICEVPATTPIEQPYDLRVGDIVVAYAGAKLRSEDPLPQAMDEPVTIIRGGRLMTLPARHDVAGGHVSPLRYRWLGPSGRPTPRAGVGRSSSSVSAVASGNESVSVSQSGDQIAVEMSLPQLSRAPIRLRGTRQQILDQMDQAGYSPAVRQRVLDAIR